MMLPQYTDLTVYQNLHDNTGLCYRLFKIFQSNNCLKYYTTRQQIILLGNLVPLWHNTFQQLSITVNLI